MVDPSSAVHGLAERWVAHERVPGERLEVAARAGQSLVIARLNLAVVGAGGEVAWRRVLGGRSAIATAAIDAQGGHVAALVEGQRLELMRGAHGESIVSIKIPDGCTAVAIADRGERLAVGDRMGMLRLIDASGRARSTIDVGHPIDFLALAPSGETAVAASATGHVTLVGAKRKPERTAYVRAQISRVWMDARGERAFVLASGEGVMVHPFRTSSMTTLGLDRAVLDADSNLAGDTVILLAHDGSVVVLDAAARLIWKGDAPEGAQRIRANHDLSRVWFHDNEGVLRMYDLLRGTEGARRAATLARGPRRAYAHEVDRRALPAPGNFERVHLDPDPATGRIALTHSDGLVVLLAQGGRELKRVRVSGAMRALLFTDRGGLLVVASDRGVALLDPLQGWRASVGIEAPVVGVVHGTSAVLAAGQDGSVALLQSDGAHAIAKLGAPVTAVTGTRTLHGNFGFAALASGEVVGLGPDGGQMFRIPAASGDAPVRLAAIGDRVLLGTAAGRLKLVSMRGASLGEAKVGLPVMSVSAIGDGFVVVDSRGEIHRWTHTLDRGEGRQAPHGTFRPAVGPEGPACLVQYDREAVVVQSWGRRELARFDVNEPIVDLAASSFERWALLTPGVLITPVPPPARRA